MNFAREIRRVHRYQDCKTTGYHVNSGNYQWKLLGGHRVFMELCLSCDVWIEAFGKLWRAP